MAAALQMVVAGVADRLTDCAAGMAPPSTMVKLKEVGVTDIVGPARFTVTLTRTGVPFGALTETVPL